ncbi:uncharacterized protein Dana_GF27106, isoform A [Drosophila ananassae]|uniref:Uncharacterized protein, isoform A n=1 Tax=Drosophila ananassae TaxID=7217 RepID=A0A0P8ZF04_DROAN|nr:uncharacterized protein LOC123257442 isoform X1 [Drosophila ananassae]KPU73297.1 uncharacterized protein Dana_GF27106, isoform A [Drosophila ananassae]
MRTSVLCSAFVLIICCNCATWFKNKYPNINCLIHNRYRHESGCPGPRRIFYTFHRVLFDCTRVYTRCPQEYQQNEYKTRGDCRNDCYYYTKPILSTDPPGNGTNNNNTNTNNTNGNKPRKFQPLVPKLKLKPPPEVKSVKNNTFGEEYPSYPDERAPPFEPPAFGSPRFDYSPFDDFPY